MENLVLQLIGLAAACLIGFLAGAGSGLVAPPGLWADAEGSERAATGSTRVGGIAGFALPNLAGAMVQTQTILLMGRDVPYVDGRPVENAPSRSDTMMVVSVDPARRRLTVLSIPRDTRVEIPGRGTEKINAALALGGPALAMQTVQNLLDVPIDRYIVLKIDGLIRMVDLIGGIDIDVPSNMRYTDRAGGLRIRLKKGFQHLDGKKAHEFVRFRHDRHGDIGRIARQQAFIQAATKKLLSPKGLFSIPQLVGALQENVETDIDGGQLLAIAAYAKGLKRDEIRMAMLPGEFSTGMKASYWLVKEDRAKRLASRLLKSDTPDPDQRPLPGASPGPDELSARADVHVAVLNGTARPRLASEAARILRTEGWTVWLIGDADRRDYTNSRILADSGDDAVAGAIAHTLNLTTNLEAMPIGTNLPLSREDIDYIVILGQDFIQALRVPLHLGG
jgi:LCP family protein required for cell wall assembly